MPNRSGLGERLSSNPLGKGPLSRIFKMKNEEGIVLLMVLFSMSLFVLLGEMALLVSARATNFSGKGRPTSQALYASKSGIEHAKLILKGNRNWDDELVGVDKFQNTEDDGILINRSFGQGSYSVKVRDNNDGDNNTYHDLDGTVMVISRGTSGNGLNQVQKEISVEVKLDNVWKHVVASSSNPPYTTYGTDYTITPAKGEGSPSSFAAIPVPDLVTYRNQAINNTSNSKTIEGEISGSIANVSESYITSSVTQSSTDYYKYDDSYQLYWKPVIIQGGLTGIIYVDGDVWLNNETTINGTLVVRGRVRISGRVIIESKASPAIVAIWDTAILPGPTLLVDIDSDEALINGIIYSNRRVRIEGAGVYGSVVADSIEIAGRTVISYDPDINQILYFNNIEQKIVINMETWAER